MEIKFEEDNKQLLKEYRAEKHRAQKLQSYKDNFNKFLFNIFGIRTISEEDAKKIIDKHRPIGNFLVFKDSSYMAIDNENGNVLVAEFLSLEKAFVFLKTEIFVEALTKW